MTTLGDLSGPPASGDAGIGQSGRKPVYWQAFMFFQGIPPGLVGSRFGRIVGAVWALVLFVVCVRAAHSPLRHSIYQADYIPAGWKWLHGAQIYHFREHFIYSPLAAAFFAPLSLLPASVGGVLWRLGCTTALLAAAAAWLRGPLPALGGVPARGRGDRTVPAALLLFLPLAVGNVNIGQMNLVILTLTLGSVLAVWRERWNLAAVLLALAALVKIYPLAIGLLLALLYPRQLSWRLALALLGLFALSFALQRPTYVWSEYHEWLGVLGRDTRLDLDPLRGWRDFGSLLRATGVPFPDRVYRFVEMLVGGLLALFLWWGQHRRRWPREKLLGGVFCLGCAWMILFGPATESATYVVLALPLCGLLVTVWTLPAGAAEPGRFVPAARAILTAAYALLLFTEVANSWISGVRWSYPIVHFLQPVAALLFTGAAVWWLARRRLPGAPAGAMLTHAGGTSENGGGDRRIG